MGKGFPHNPSGALLCGQEKHAPILIHNQLNGSVTSSSPHQTRGFPPAPNSPSRRLFE